MKYKVTKMDGRYTNYGYTHLIEFSKLTTFESGVLDFDRSRRWFNETFGWSQDVETRSAMQKNRRSHRELYNDEDINTEWAYCVKYGDYRIYVTDKALTMFQLRWSQDKQ